MTDAELDQWSIWSKRDDWHTRFVASDIRQMIGEIVRLRDQLAAERQAHKATVQHANEIISWHQ